MDKKRFARWSFVAFMMTLPVTAGLASCDGELPGERSISGGEAGGLPQDPGAQCIGPNCAGPSCDEYPRPGCACATEGKHIACGKVEEEIGGQEVCGKGFSVCTGGKYDACIIDNAVTLVPIDDGQHAESYGTAQNCVNNPCDPGCLDFQDTPTGIDAGAALSVKDGGLTLTGDGGSVCVPKTCTDQAKNCGPVSDGCGGLLSCGTCTAPMICGGAGVPSVCGVSPTCTNLCPKQVVCSGGATTSVTGTVYAPNGTDPLPNATVYVPNGTVTAFTAGVACETCAAVSGSPLVTTTTAVDGTFTLNNMPVGTNIPLVIQVGRWRRQVTIPAVTSCTSTAVAATLTRLPRNKTEGDIPKMAFVTGDVDAMECVWRKIGVADSEFTNPNSTGRINFYAGGGSPGTYINNIGGTNGTPVETTLLSSATTLNQYDMVLFPCQGEEYNYNKNTEKTYAQNIANYANAGGRIFATHYSYVWLTNDNSSYFSPLSGAINWNVGQTAPSPDPQTGYVDTSFTKGATLATWLKLVGASSTLGQISINTLRRDFNSVVSPSQRWMYVNSPSAGIPQHATFNTPLGVPAANQCGRVVFSDFHVENSSDTNFAFPTECPGGAMTPQEKLLEFMLFDLANCVTPDQGPSCVPTTCSAQGLNCGPAGDGCGGTLSCGTCASPTTCGGGGQSGVCGTPKVYTDGTFTRDYDASTLCPSGKLPVWELMSWNTTTPSDSHIDMSVQTASTKAGLASAPVDSLLFSNPPGPAALVNTAVSAHAANVPSSGKPDTELGSESTDYTLQKNNRQRSNAFLRITYHLVPSTDKLSAPTLWSWDQQVSCVDAE